MRSNASYHSTNLARWLRRFSAALLAIGLAAIIGQGVWQAQPTARATTLTSPTPPAGAALPSGSQPRVYLPLMRGGDSQAAGQPGSSPTATPMSAPTSPPSGPQPTVPPVPPGEGGMEPVAPDWIAQCAPDTVPFEAQAWWIEDFGHVHVGFCAPQGKRISGKYTFKVRLILHNNPGVLTLLQGQLDSSSYGGQTVKVNLTCPIDQTCMWDREVTVDTAAFPNDGWHHIRIRAVVEEPDGKQLVATNFIPVYFNNGKPVEDYSGVTVSGTTDYVAGRGWYTDANYVWSVVFAPRTASEPVRGNYEVTLRPMATDTPQPISRFIVKLDATHTSAGTTVYDTTSSSTKPLTLNIDTRKLSNGWHSLLARTEVANLAGGSCGQCSGQPQTSAGVTKVWFYVQN